MSDRVTLVEAVAVIELPAAPRANRRPMLNDMVGVGDHRPVLAQMALLAALLAPGLLLGALLARLRRVTGWRQRAASYFPRKN
jgi:hypothetical protein